MGKQDGFKNPALNTVLEYQDEVKTAAIRIADLKAAIEVQEAIVNSATSFKTRLPEYLMQREDLLAEMATGAANHDELKTLDGEIAIEKQRQKDFLTQAAQSVPDAKQTVAGLRRKLDSAVVESETMKGRKPSILAALLQAEAEQAGAEYLQLALKLGEKYQLLLAIGRLLANVGGGRTTKVIAPAVDLVIPIFLSLEVHRGCDHPNRRHGELWDAVLNTFPDAIGAAAKEEAARITSLGVEW
ncbi:MAG: hypothetical protein ACD_75C01523G0007 [uncultured bacterium]|nr:MAG: hypothetical protein ACD_75C01523G0007 [uncultured bacterium]